MLYVMASSKQHLYGICLVKPSRNSMKKYSNIIKNAVRDHVAWIDKPGVIPTEVLETIDPQSRVTDAHTAQQHFDLHHSLLKWAKSGTPAPNVRYVLPSTIHRWNTLKDPIDSAGKHAREFKYRTHAPSITAHYTAVRLVQMALINARSYYTLTNMHALTLEDRPAPQSLEALSTMLSRMCTYQTIVSVCAYNTAKVLGLKRSEGQSRIKQVPIPRFQAPQRSRIKFWKKARTEMDQYRRNGHYYSTCITRTERVTCAMCSSKTKMFCKDCKIALCTTDPDDNSQMSCYKAFHDAAQENLGDAAKDQRQRHSNRKANISQKGSRKRGRNLQYTPGHERRSASPNNRQKKKRKTVWNNKNLRRKLISTPDDSS